MSEANKATCRRIIDEIWNQGNLSAIDELLSPEYAGVAPPETMHGPEGYRALVTKYRAAFPDIQMTIEEMVAEGDKVSLRWSATFTHTGALDNIAATGRRGTTSGVAIIRFADGKSVEERGSYDALGMLQQLGVVTLPGQAKSQSSG